MADSYENSKAALAYRRCVLPLSVYLMLAGMLLPVFAWVLPVPVTSPFPFIESESVNRNLLGSSGALAAVIGVGLIFRYRWAWYALLAFCLVGVLVPILAIFDGRGIASFGPMMPILGSLFNGVIGIGIFFVTRPAFQVKSESGA